MMLFLLIWLGLVLIRPQDYPALADLGIPLLPITLLGSVAMWALASDRRPLNQPTHLLFAVFIVIGMFSVAVNGWVGGGVQVFLDFLPALLAMVVLSQAAYSPKNCLRIMAVIALAAVVLTVHGIEQVELGEGWTGMPTVQDGRIQYVGIFSDPNDLAMLFVMAIPMAALLAGRGGMLGLRRLFWWAVALLLVYGVYLTDSRGAFLAVMAMAGVWLWLKRGLLIAGTLGAVGMTVLMMLPTRMQELDAGESSAYGRIETWYDGIQMFLGYPIFGVGVNNFTEHTYLTAHNSFVLVLAETGIIGYTVWLPMVVYCFMMPIMVLRLPENLDDAEHQPLWTAERRMAMTLLIAQVGFFACAFFLSRSYVILLYILLGLVTGWYGGAQERWAGLPVFSVQHDWLKWCVISMASIVGLWLTVKVLFVLAA
ncbi:O-antigen ligase family protein [Luteimonas marina]|uniref:O-antigen ligase family protein n=1 Tax=Luteimonas marina TaxID=488485 RepID=A0A5C5TTD0_9GAMM|nr:O-antigen ligase family protein [Luteimonas marina]TWT17244.1 O-antigen ligase family protein [Luteimonas marina]